MSPGTTAAALAAAAVAIALAAAPAPASPAPARAPEICEGTPPVRPTPAQRRERLIESAMAFRRSYTLRADRPFVEMVQASRTARRRGRFLGYGRFAVTPSEARYFRHRRSRVEEGADRLYPFLRRHRDIHGGVSIEDDFRNGAFALVRLATERPERFLPRLRRVAGVRVEVKRVAFSERYLDRVHDRIGRALDEDPLPEVTVGVSFIDIDANQVVLEVATRRTDAQAEVTRRFGPAVRLDVAAAEPTVVACTSLDRVVVGRDDRELHLEWSGSGSITFEHTFLEETAETVRVGVFVRAPTFGAMTADLQRNSEPVRLASPLGERRVLDAETGKRLEVRRRPRRR